jgi:ABC-type glycerol-3-phosphate transport system substrate-binding protein
MTRRRSGACRLRARTPGRLLVVLAALAVVAAGCGGTGSSSRDTVLRVIMTDDWVTAPFVDAVREFERTHPDVRVDIDKGPIKDMADVVRAGISSGSPPDVVQGHAHVGAGQDLAEPVDDLWKRHNITAGEFLPGAVEDVTWGGRRYGLPLDTNAMALLYNADLFALTGQRPPDPSMSFGDFERLAQALTSPDKSRRGLVIPVDSWVSYGWIKANGGELVQVGPNGRPTFTLDSPAVVDTLTYLQRLVDEGWAFGPAGPDARSADAYALFRSGAVAMYASGSWDLVRILKEAPKGHFGVALMPRGLTGATEGTAMGGSSLWIPRGSKHRELAFEFMQLVTSDKYALRFAKEEGRLPVRPRLFADPYFQEPMLKVFVEQLETAHPPILGALHDASDAFDGALNQVLREHAAPSTALKEAQARAVASVGPS